MHLYIFTFEKKKKEKKYLNFHRFFIKYLNRYIHRNRTLKKFFDNSQLTNSINFNWKKNYTERVINKEQIARGIFIRFKKKGERKSLDRSGDPNRDVPKCRSVGEKKKSGLATLIWYSYRPTRARKEEYSPRGHVASPFPSAVVTMYAHLRMCACRRVRNHPISRLISREAGRQGRSDKGEVKKRSKISGKEE